MTITLFQSLVLILGVILVFVARDHCVEYRARFQMAFTIFVAMLVFTQFRYLSNEVVEPTVVKVKVQPVSVQLPRYASVRRAY